MTLTVAPTPDTVAEVMAGLGSMVASCPSFIAAVDPYNVDDRIHYHADESDLVLGKMLRPSVVIRLLTSLEVRMNEGCLLQKSFTFALTYCVDAVRHISSSDSYMHAMNEVGALIKDLGAIPTAGEEFFNIHQISLAGPLARTDAHNRRQKHDFWIAPYSIVIANGV